MDKELDRIQQEKLELVPRMEALTVYESTLEARASEIPEQYAELASRRRTEPRSEGHTPEAGLPATLGPRDPRRISRNEQPAAPAPPTAPPKASAMASSAGAKSISSRDGTMFEPAGPKEKKKDPGK